MDDTSNYARIAGYFNAANLGDQAKIAEYLADNVKSYTSGHPPRFGKKEVTNFFAQLHTAQARWTVDKVISQENESVVEWSMMFTAPENKEERLYRGIDWVQFDDAGLITLIREFNYSMVAEELSGFPYTDFGYPDSDTFDSMLPNKKHRF